MPQAENVTGRLFRAVSKAELDDVANFGGFRQKQDGLSYEGKLFAARIEDAAGFRRINYQLDTSIGLDDPFHILEVGVSSALAAQFEVYTLDFMSAVYVSEDLLSLLNWSGSTTEVAAIPYESK